MMAIGGKLAGAMFDCQRQMDRLDSVLLGALHDFYARSGCWVKRLDYYDNSIEWWVIEGSELDEIDRATLWELGFARCWLCASVDAPNGVEEGNGWERYYDHKGNTSVKLGASGKEK